MFIDVGDGLSVNTEKIEAVRFVDDFNCIIYTNGSTFESPMPKSVVVGLIDAHSGKKDSMSNVEKLLAQIYAGQVTARP